MQPASAHSFQRWPDFCREPRRGLLVVRRWVADDQVAITDSEVGRELLSDVLRCADRLVAPWMGHAVVLEQAPVDALGLLTRVTDDNDADAHRALDLAGVAPHFVAMAKQDLLLRLDRLEAVAQVVGVPVPGDEPQRDLLAAAADQYRQVRLNGAWIVPHVLSVVLVAGRGRCLTGEHAAHDWQRF